MSENADMVADLRRIVGDDAYNVLVCRFGGGKIYIPKTGYSKIRNKRIKEEFDSYLSSGISSSKAIDFLSREYNLSPSWIRKIL